MTTPQPRRNFNLDDKPEDATNVASSLRQREAFSDASEHHPLAPCQKTKPCPPPV